MPAPDFETIYKFEETIEPAYVSILRGAELDGVPTVNAFASRELSQVKTPYVILQLVMGGSTEHFATVQGNWRPDIWNASLQLQIVTDRTNNNLSHSDYRAKVRAAMAADADIKSDTLLPYHEVFSCLESGTAPSIRTEDDLDVSVLSYAVKFGIRADGWPT